jgi:diacylglycerol kinase family enzyme
MHTPLAQCPQPRVDATTPLYVLLNASSGSSDAQQERVDIDRVLDEAGRRHEILVIDAPQQLGEATKRALDLAIRNSGAIVVAGGDGTINTVAQAVLPTGLPFGIVPQGTFNYSSRAQSIPLDTVEATRALLTARLKPAQIGAVNDRIFLVNASLGLYPELLEDREQYKHRYGRNRVVAFWAGLRTLSRSHRQLLLEIEHDRERELVRTPSLFVGNNALQLEQVGLPESEDVERRRLAAVIVRPVGTKELLSLAMRGALGRLGDDDRVRNFAFQRMTVMPVGRHGARRIKVATDGEICWLEPPLTFSVAPQPLQLMVPAGDDAA